MPGFQMDSLITGAARALAAGNPLGALNRVALRDDAPALAPRGLMQNSGSTTPGTNHSKTPGRKNEKASPLPNANLSDFRHADTTSKTRPTR